MKPLNPKKAKDQTPNTPPPDYIEPGSTPLLKLYQFLSDLGLFANWRKPILEQPFEQVTVVLDQDPEAEQLEYVMQIAFVEDLQAGFAGREPSYDNGATLMFSLSIPLEIKKEKLLDTYQLFAILNRILPYGYLGINDGTDTPIPFFTHRLINDTPYFNMLMVVHIIEAIQIFIQQMIPLTKQLMKDDGDVEHIIEEIEKELFESTRQQYQSISQ